MKILQRLKKTVVILISAYELDNLKGIEEYLTKCKIMEEKLKILLTGVFELDILELPKAKRALQEGKLDDKGNLKEWIKFFINPYEKEDLRMIDVDKELKKAYEILEHVNSNPEEREKVERRIRELRSLEYAKEYEYNQGLESGIKKGIEEGIKEGAKEKQLEIAKKLLSKKVSIEEIVEITDLSKEEIENLKSNS